MIHIKKQDHTGTTVPLEVILKAPPVAQLGQAVHLLQDVAVEFVQHNGRDGHHQPDDLHIVIVQGHRDAAGQKDREQQHHNAAALLVAPEGLQPLHQIIYGAEAIERNVHNVQRAVVVDVLRIHIPDLPCEQGHGLQHHMERQQASDALLPQNAAAEAFAAQKAQIRRTAQLNVFYQLMQPDRFCRGAVQRIAQPLAQCRRADDQKQDPGDILVDDFSSCS